MDTPSHRTRAVNQDSDRESYADFIRSMVRKHGPDPQDDETVHRIIREVQIRLKTGDFTIQDIRYLRGQFDYTLSSCDTLQGHALAKPYGYPGDFELLDKIFTGYVSPDPRLSRWDDFFHRLDACEAVRNRKTWLLDQLRRKQADCRRQIQVLIVGSGPGRDVREFLERPDADARFDCIELDPKAIDYASDLCAPVANHVRFVQGNILRFTTDTRYDFIWAGGLFDYFNDRVFARAVVHLMALLREGGELVIGNFAARNSSQAFMELVSDWKLTLRTPEQLKRLATQSGIDGAVSVESEPRGVNLFLRISP